MKIWNTRHRNGSTRLASGIAMASFIALTFQSALAQDTNDTDAESDSLDEIVVIGAKRKFAPSDSSAATKIRMDVLDTPQSMTIVSRELLNITGADSYGDVASLAPNMLDNDRDLSVFFDAVARGFHVDFRQGYKVNAVPIINEGFIVEFDLVERAELVRGPSSIIYGQSDYGSTLNLQLKKPQAERAVVGELTFGSNSRFKAMLDSTGSLTDSGRLTGRLVLVHEDAEHSQDFASRETTTIAPSIAYDFSDDTRIEVSSFYAERDVQESWGFTLTNTFALPDVRKDGFFSTDFSRTIQRTTYVHANLSHKITDDLNLSVVAAYSNASNDWHEPYLYGLASAAGDVDLYDYYADRQLDVFTANTTLAGTFEAFGRSHEFMVDAFYRENSDDFYCCYFGYFGTMNLLNPDPGAFNAVSIGSVPLNQQDETDLALGGLLLLHPTDRLTILAGARWTKYENAPQGANGWFFVTDKFDNDAVVPRLGMVYSINDNLNLFASYSSGVQFRRALTSGGSNLDPEEGKQWEVGLKARVLDEKLDMSFAYFTIDRENVAAADPAFPGQPFSVGIDGQKHEGFEFEAIGEPIPGWNILASYGYLDVSVTDAPDPGMIGQQRANSPYYQAKVYSTYEVLDGALAGLSFGGGVVHVGERQVDNFGTIRLPDYTRLDARIAYDGFERTSISLNFTNLTDEDILASYDESPYSGIIFQDYRAVIAKITTRF